MSPNPNRENGKLQTDKTELANLGTFNTIGSCNSSVIATSYNSQLSYNMYKTTIMMYNDNKVIQYSQKIYIFLQ